MYYNIVLFVQTIWHCIYKLLKLKRCKLQVSAVFYLWNLKTLDIQNLWILYKDTIRIGNTCFIIFLARFILTARLKIHSSEAKGKWLFSANKRVNLIQFPLQAKPVYTLASVLASEQNSEREISCHLVATRRQKRTPFQQKLWRQIEIFLAQ